MQTGLPDLAVANLKPDQTLTNTNALTIFLKFGNKSLVGPIQYRDLPRSSFVVAADLNADGLPDLALENSTEVFVFLNNTQKAFSQDLNANLQDVVRDSSAGRSSSLGMTFAAASMSATGRRD